MSFGRSRCKTYRCLLFAHKLSLYSFWALAVRKPDLVAFGELFRP